MGGSNTLGALTELEVQPDMIDEQAKKNSQDKESQMLTKSHVPGEESLYFCICANFLSRSEQILSGITVVQQGYLAERRGRKKVPGGDQ